MDPWTKQTREFKSKKNDPDWSTSQEVSPDESRPADESGRKCPWIPIPVSISAMSDSCSCIYFVFCTSIHIFTLMSRATRTAGRSICLSYLNSSLNFGSWISRLICDWTRRLIKILVTRFFVFFTFISTFDHNSNYHCDYNDNKYFFELQKSIIECHMIAYATGILKFISSIWYSISPDSDCSCIIPWASGNAWGTL